MDFSECNVKLMEWQLLSYLSRKEKCNFSYHHCPSKFSITLFLFSFQYTYYVHVCKNPLAERIFPKSFRESTFPFSQIYSPTGKSLGGTCQNENIFGGAFTPNITSFAYHLPSNIKLSSGRERHSGTYSSLVNNAVNFCAEVNISRRTAASHLEMDFAEHQFNLNICAIKATFTYPFFAGGPFSTPDH